MSSVTLYSNTSDKKTFTSPSVTSPLLAKNTPLCMCDFLYTMTMLECPLDLLLYVLHHECSSTQKYLLCVAYCVTVITLLSGLKVLCGIVRDK